MTRVLLASGKVVYDLEAERDQARRTTAPPSSGSSSSPRCRPRRSPPPLAEYPGAEVVWVQDEPRNQGAWPFMALNLPQALAEHAEGRSLRVVARKASASPATGSTKKHAASRPS